MTKYPHHRKSGFTLIELSIVLVVIGLVVGGVLVGGNLIHAAAVRSQISQIEQYTTAVYTFQTKYACLPGDCPNAVQHGLGNSGGPGRNGDGDGNITAAAWGGFEFSLSTHAIGSMARESLDFWYHLQQARLIGTSLVGFTGQTEFTTTGVPASTMPAGKLNPLSIVIPTAFGGGLGNGYSVVTVGGFFAGTSIPSIDAGLIDGKLDDGLPQTGLVRCGLGGRQAFTYATTPGTAHCGYTSYPDNLCSAWGGGNSYFMGSGGTCVLTFGNQF